MECPQCQHENPPGAKFCVECASPIAPRCPACGTEAPPTAKFCPECAGLLTGTPQAAPKLTAPPASPAPTAPTTDGERRQLTALFCDLVGSTAIASHLDPEEWHRISTDYQHAAAAAVTRFGGHVDKFLGDGLVCFFGVPQAHEDDAERAVRAGLAIVDAVRALKNPPVSPFFKGGEESAPPFEKGGGRGDLFRQRYTPRARRHAHGAGRCRARWGRVE